MKNQFVSDVMPREDASKLSQFLGEKWTPSGLLGRMVCNFPNLYCLFPAQWNEGEEAKEGCWETMNVSPKVMNSAMMPVAGNYRIKEVSREEWIALLKKYQKTTSLKSYVGYPENLRLIQQWSGISLPVCKDETRLDPVDICLVMKLKYRIEGMKKNLPVQADDFQFFVIVFEAEDQWHLNKTCDNCHHQGTPLDQTPCLDCVNGYLSGWQPR